MKIERTDRLGGTNKTRKKTAASSDNTATFNALLNATETSQDVSAKSEVEHTHTIPGLLGLQEIEDNTPSPAEHKQTIEHGEALLERLHSLHQSILLGKIPAQELRAISERLAERKQTSPDPKIQAVIQEIEVRAAVELAKLEKMA